MDGPARPVVGARVTEPVDEWRRNLGSRYMLVPIGLFGLLLWILCAILLGLAWWLRRRQNRRRLAQWDLEERMHARSEPTTQVIAPPSVPW